jgi:hypothetical protein
VTSHRSAPLRHGAPPRLFRDVGRAPRTPDPATIERVQCRSHRTRQIERLASTVAWHIAGRDGAYILGPTASGCGTGLIHCGGQTGRRFAAEMRYCTDSHGKTAARSCGRSSLLQGRLTRRIERPTPRGRSYASYLGGR